MEAGAGRDLTDDDGKTALMLACDRGHEEIVRLLVEAGAEKALKDD